MAEEAEDMGSGGCAAFFSSFFYLLVRSHLLVSTFGFLRTECFADGTLRFFGEDDI